MNMGKKDGIAPNKVIGMINDNTQDRDINIGSIDVMENFSFFEVSKQHEAKVINSFQKSHFKGRPVNIEIANEKTGSKGRKKKKGSKR